MRLQLCCYPSHIWQRRNGLFLFHLKKNVKKFHITDIKQVTVTISQQGKTWQNFVRKMKKNFYVIFGCVAWYGSGSADPYSSVMDPDRDLYSAPNPALFVSGLITAYYFLKVPVHFLSIFAWWWKDPDSGRISKVQKRTDPDPQHWFKNNTYMRKMKLAFLMPNMSVCASPPQFTAYTASPRPKIERATYFSYISVATFRIRIQS